MQLDLIAVGRLKSGAPAALFDDYWSRLATAGRQVGITRGQLVELAESRAASSDQRKRAEADAIAARCVTGSKRIALDEHGASFDSRQFAARLGDWRDGGVANVALIIGGADGLSHTLTANCDLTLSLGRLTLPHQIARIVLAEQLYRACTILAGHPYHRD